MGPIGRSAWPEVTIRALVRVVHAGSSRGAQPGSRAVSLGCGSVTSEQSDRPTISVLLPVHAGVDAGFLERALESIAEQTLPADEVVVVEDGPLPVASGAVISRFEARGRPPLVRVVLETNAGPGVANGAGLLRCSGEWVAKADADDISLPTRFAEQMDCLAKRWCRCVRHGDVGVLRCGDQRGGRPSRSVGPRVDCPSDAHQQSDQPPDGCLPTGCGRRGRRLSRTTARGGLRPVRADAPRGARMVNLSEPLVLFRADDSMFDRRSGREFLRIEWRLQRNLRSYGLIGTPQLFLNLLVRLGFRYLPRPLLRRAYRTFLVRPTGGQPLRARPPQLTSQRGCRTSRRLRLPATRPTALEGTSPALRCRPISAAGAGDRPGRPGLDLSQRRRPWRLADG